MSDGTQEPGLTEDRLDELRKVLQKDRGVVAPLHRRMTPDLAAHMAKVFNNIEELQIKKVDESIMAGKINPVLLYNKALADIDPASPSITDEQMQMVIEESANNPVYFLYLTRLGTKGVDK